MKVNKYYKDDNDEYFVVFDGCDEDGYKIVKGLDDIDKAKALLAHVKAMTKDEREAYTVEEAQEYADNWTKPEDED